MRGVFAAAIHDRSVIPDCLFTYYRLSYRLTYLYDDRRRVGFFPIPSLAFAWGV